MKIVNKHHNTMLGTMRVLSPVLALAMLFTLFGCAGDSPAPSASPVPSESIPTFSPEPDETEHQLTAERSEERRVGKECRSRWSLYH